jgi:hypothetical protein
MMLLKPKREGRKEWAWVVAAADEAEVEVGVVGDVVEAEDVKSNNFHLPRKEASLLTFSYVQIACCFHQ